MKVSTFQILAHHFADDGAPGAILLQVAVVVDALELLVIVLDQRIERSSTRVAGFINSCRCGLHPLHNRQGRKMSEKIRLTNCRTATTAPRTFLGGLQEALPGSEKMPPGMAAAKKQHDEGLKSHSAALLLPSERLWMKKSASAMRKRPWCKRYEKAVGSR
jgi:hypothetical protein